MGVTTAFGCTPSTLRIASVRATAMWPREPGCAEEAASLHALDFDRLARATGLRGGERDPKRFHSVRYHDRWRPILQDVPGKILQLQRVRALEAFHEIGHGVVRDAVLRHCEDRRLAEIAHAHGAGIAK